MTHKVAIIRGRMYLKCPKCGEGILLTKEQQTRVHEGGFAVVCKVCSEPTYLRSDETYVEEA